MPGIENILPVEKQFNTTLSEVSEQLNDEFYERVRVFGDIIDPNSEFSRNPLHYWELSGHLAGSLASEDEPLEEVRTALYRGFCFAFQVVHDIKPRPISTVSVARWLEEQSPDESVADIITVDVNEYLGQRPNVDILIGNFALDVAPQYVHHVETSAGFMFMLSEQGLAQSYIDDYIESARPQQIIDKE